jgi:hypothetical protein
MSARAPSGKPRDYRVAFNWSASQTPPMQLAVSVVPLPVSKAV